jgi:hypothetical protein
VLVIPVTDYSVHVISDHIFPVICRCTHVIIRATLGLIRGVLGVTISIHKS